MTKINLHIEIVSSTELGLSSMSRESRDAIFAVLARHYTSVGITIVNNLADLEALVIMRPDLVFLGMKFVPANPSLGFVDPDKIWISQYLDEHDIAYTGSSKVAHELEFNKPLAKQQVLDAGLQTAQFCIARQGQPLDGKNMPLSFPVFVKPTDRGGGLGVDGDSLVRNFDELESKVQAISSLCSDSLIEEYLPGREFSVALLRDETSNAFSLMPIELVAPSGEHGARLLSGEVKSSNAEQVLEVNDPDIRSKVTSLAINVFHALGARDYGRIDIRLDESGTPQFLEANLIPSLISGYGSFPKACEMNEGLSYEPMILGIANLALARSKQDREDDPEIVTLNRVALTFPEIAF